MNLPHSPRLGGISALAVLVAIVTFGAVAEDPQLAGPTDTGFLLPNGWHLTPAGRQVPTSDMLLNIEPLADNTHAVITCSGFNEHFIGLVDLDEGTIVASQPAYQSWFGLEVSPDGTTAWWSGGGEGRTLRFGIDGDTLTWQSTPSPQPLRLSLPEIEKLKERYSSTGFRGGLCLDPQRRLLYCLETNAGRLVAEPLADVDGGEAFTAGSRAPLSLGGRPYDVQLGASGRLLYVSDWAGGHLVVVDAEGWRIVDTIPVGEHPNQIVLSPDGRRLFVACGSTNAVWVVDTLRGVVTETISTSLFPDAPEGSTPDAVAVAPDGETLYVANADNNCVAVVDISVPGRSSVKGFIPTGWYPTAVSVTPDGRRLLVGVGKGLETRPNPLYGPDFDESTLTDLERFIKTLMPFPYIGTRMSGSLAIVDIPTNEELEEYTRQVYRNCPFSGELLSVSNPQPGNPIPSRVGDPSPLRYVIYVIKENRTYDQVFGDLAEGDSPKGNGDPSLCMFPRTVTPNHHKLAEEFVLLDNFYCNGQVSRDGHPWSTMAYNTDYISRDWHLTYSQRLGVDDDEEESLSAAPAGYIWDACLRAGISYRSYGEKCTRVTRDDGRVEMAAAVAGLEGHVCPTYGLRDDDGGRPRDKDQIDVFLDEYRQFTETGDMPRFIVISLGEDHTDGTTPGAHTPAACVGSNDLALGKLVEAVSQGPLWKQTAIFVIQDDAQNGPDHVDAQRTVALAISPYTRRGIVDSTMYSTVSMIRTMELILGLEPLSQYDAAARPMFEAFTDVADPAPYICEPAQIDLEARNDASSYGAARSARMDFSEYDRIDDGELNEILWRAVKGAEAPLPPAVRRAIAFRPYRPMDGLRPDEPGARSP